MKISSKHPNRQPYNWLAYDMSDSFLAKFVSSYKGALYDLGCGEMPYREWFLQYVDSYTSVDWSNTPHTLKADLITDLNQPLPVGDAVSDTIISLSVMEHLREPGLFLEEAFRILRPGGVMVVQVPFMWGVHEAPHDYYRYTRYGLEYMFNKAGFQEVEIFPQTGFWVMWTLKFNYQTARLVRGPWPVRMILRLIMSALWEVDQRVARSLDKHWPSEQETAGYFVLAKKTQS